MPIGNELSGRPVFGITDSRKIGEIKDLYLDQKLKKVYYLNIGQMGLPRHKALIVRREDGMVFD